MNNPTGYELSRDWFDFCFENPELIKPTHTALYFFAIEHCNRLGWKEKFGFPTQMAMDAIGIKNWRTYSAAFEDIVKWGFFEIKERSKNQYSATVIAIVKNTKANTKALAKAIQKHVQKQSSGIAVIDKPINQEQINSETTSFPSKGKENIFDEFRKLYPGSKRGLNTEFENYQRKHKDWAECLMLLTPAIQKEIQYHAKKKYAGEFVPEYANLSTWINQRRWETEIPNLEENEEAKQYTRRKITDLV